MMIYMMTNYLDEDFKDVLSQKNSVQLFTIYFLCSRKGKEIRLQYVSI